MLGLAFLLVGLVCAVVARILLFVAAARVSVGWTLGLFLPFGPLLFRLNYPEAAYPSRYWRYAVFPCLFFYVVLGPGPAYQQYMYKVNKLATTAPASYSIEAKKSVVKPAAAAVTAATAKPAGPTVELAPNMGNLDARRDANFKEMQRLRTWADALKLRKRDLLHSDAEGNRLYNKDLADYNDALAKATVEKNAIAAASK